MTTAAPSTPLGTAQGWLARAEHWLDDKGKGAWIAAMVLGFILVWPIGLALLLYMIWSKRMFTSPCRTSRRTRAALPAHQRPTGNTAFDTYKADTLRRLEEEQERFEEFLERLREAKDKSEFDQFMDERARKAQGTVQDTARSSTAGDTAEA